MGGRGWLTVSYLRPACGLNPPPPFEPICNPDWGSCSWLVMHQRRQAATAAGSQAAAAGKQAAATAGKLLMIDLASEETGSSSSSWEAAQQCSWSATYQRRQAAAAAGSQAEAAGKLFIISHASKETGSSSSSSSWEATVLMMCHASEGTGQIIEKVYIERTSVHGEFH